MRHLRLLRADYLPVFEDFIADEDENKAERF